MIVFSIDVNIFWIKLIILLRWNYGYMCAVHTSNNSRKMEFIVKSFKKEVFILRRIKAINIYQSSLIANYV
jgi:hypothetical protein